MDFIKLSTEFTPLIKSFLDILSSLAGVLKAFDVLKPATDAAANITK